MNFRFGSRANQSKGVIAINDPVPDFGGDYFADTNLHTLNTAGQLATNNQTGWAQVQVITTAVFNAATQVNITGLAGVSIPAGTILRGIFASIQLTSGSVIAYRATESSS